MAGTAIIGGGLTGAWIAYLLASEGRDVVVYDGGSQPFRASDANPGGLNPLHGPGIPGPLEAFQLGCHQLHRDHGDRIRELSGIDYHLRIIDRLFVAFSEGDVAELRDMERLYAAASGFDAIWLDPHQVRFLEPRVSDRVLGGLLTRGNGVVDSQRYCQALLSAALRLGARHEARDVRALVQETGRVTHVEVDGGRDACDTLVIANGCWSSEFCAQLGFPLTIAPIKGQMLVVRIPGRPFDWDITHGLTGLYQYRDDLYWLGGTREDPAVAPGLTDDGRALILDKVRAMVPGIAGFEVVSHQAGYRPGSPDGFPVVGPVPGHENVHIATGGGSKGVLQCAGMARVLVDQLAGQPAPYPLLSPERFVRP